jgi:hypothetical protein
LHGDIEMSAAEVEGLDTRIEAYPDIGILPGEFRELGHQPVIGHSGMDAQIDGAFGLAADHAQGGALEFIEQTRDLKPEGATDVGQLGRAGAALKEADVEIVFQDRDLTADGHLAYPKFLGGSGESFVPGRNGEGAQGVERKAEATILHNLRFPLLNEKPVKLPIS